MKQHILYITMFLFAFCTGQAQMADWLSSANDMNLQTNGVGYSADGSKIISGTNCHPANIRVFDAQAGNLLWDYEVPSSLLCIMGVGISSNGKYMAAIEEFGNLLIFDNSVSPPDSINTISIGSPYAFSMAFSPDSKKMAVGGSDGKLVICDVEKGVVLHTIDAHPNWVTCVQFSSTGNEIVSGGNGGEIKVWDTTGTLLNTLNGHSTYITKVVCDANDKIYSSSKDRTIKKWDLSTGVLEYSQLVSNAHVNALDVSSAGNYVISTSYDKLISVFNSSDLSVVSSFTDTNAAVGISLACSPINDQIVIGTLDGKVVAYSLSNAISTNEVGVFKYPKIFPNPFKTTLKIENLPKSGKTLQIIDGKGVLVYEGNIKELNHDLQLEHLKAGLYIIQILDTYHQVLHKAKAIKQ